MQLVSLNVWGGREFDALSKFFKEVSGETDVFCFQEVYDSKECLRVGNDGTHFNLLNELTAILPDFNHYFVPEFKANDFAAGAALEAEYGPAIFYKKNLIPIDNGSFYTAGALREFHEEDNQDVGIFQYGKFKAGERILAVGNLHGIAAWSKDDTTARLEQSRKVKEFFSGIEGSKILCGDFNLNPDTKSIALLGHDMRNLISEFHIETTRSDLNREKYRGQAVEDRISDYFFVSPDIEVKFFIVPEIEVSDHLPLVVSFS